MSYFEFPHTRSYDGDLGYIIKRLNELTEKYGEFMEYNQIKFADPLDWDINAVYAAWNIVFDTQSRGYYLAKKPVPAGVAISNNDYWELIIPFGVDTALNIDSYNPIANAPVTSRFNQIAASISNVSNMVREEGIARENADTALDIRIAAVEDAAEHLSGSISNERTERETADTALSRDIDAVSTRVDNIAQTIVPGGTSGDAELADIRLAFNGILYPNAGDSVRGQAEFIYDKTLDLEKYCYTKTNDNEYNCYSSTQNYFALTSPLIVGHDYEAFIKFNDFDSGDFNKIAEVATYSAQSGASKRNILLSSSDIDGDITYTVDFIASTADALYIALSTESSFSYTNKSVSVTIYDKSVKFASKTTENVVNDIKSDLTKTLSFSDIDFTTGYYQLINGTTAANANFMVSGFIKVTEGMPLEFSIHSYNNVGMAVLFASDKTTVKRAFYTSTEQTTYEVETTIAAGEEYIRFCRWSNNKGDDDTLSLDIIAAVVTDINNINEQLAILGESQWNNKEWHCFGTSISNASSEGKYPAYLEALSGLNYHNFAYSGGTIINQILTQIQNDANIADADLITVEGFVNDWSQQTPLGLITDTTANTFYGALYVAITYILEHSNATLVFITDSTGTNYDNIDIRREAMRNGLTQNDFIDATVKMCNYMGIPVIDAGRKSCISQDTAALYIVDQIHHTEKGGEQYAQTIWAELKNIKPRVK